MREENTVKVRGYKCEVENVGGSAFIRTVRSYISFLTVIPSPIHGVQKGPILSVENLNSENKSWEHTPMDLFGK